MRPGKAQDSTTSSRNQATESETQETTAFAQSRSLRLLVNLQLLEEQGLQLISQLEDGRVTSWKHVASETKSNAFSVLGFSGIDHDEISLCQSEPGQSVLGLATLGIGSCSQCGDHRLLFVCALTEFSREGVDEFGCSAAD